MIAANLTISHMENISLHSSMENLLQVAVEYTENGNPEADHDDQDNNPKGMANCIAHSDV